MRTFIEKLKKLSEWGGTKREIIFLILGGLSLINSIFRLLPLPFDTAWITIILCGLPIILEAVIGLVTAFSRARAGIEKLVRLTPRTARLLTEADEKIIPAEQVKVGEDSSIQRMIRLVRSADAGKAKIVSLADRWATWIVVLALSAAVLTWLISGEIIRVVTILVVFCPCALVLARPAAIMAAIVNAGKHGFLVRKGDALERLSKVSKITFDKTGTLTCGTPTVIAVETVSSFSEKEIYGYAAAAEQLSEHPLGKAVVNCYRLEPGNSPEPASEFSMIPGQGVTAVVNGRTVKAGNLKLTGSAVFSTSAASKTEKYLGEGCTIIYISIGDTPAGYIVLSDTVRKESPAMIRDIYALGIQPVLLTGDNQNAAGTIGRKLGIREIYADCLPENKLEHIEKYQKEGKQICMIGDGINYAPALKKADVGSAMGGVGSDIAVEAADIALVDDEIREFPHLLALSRKMMTTINVNLTFSMGLNFLAVTLAVTGLLSPVAGALVHNTGSVLVIINSSLLLRWKKK